MTILTAAAPSARKDATLIGLVGVQPTGFVTWPLNSVGVIS